MFSDPQDITVNAVQTILPRTGADLNNGIFRAADGSYTMSLTHTYGKRIRRVHRVDYKVLAPDVMDSSLNVPYSASFYLVADVPEVGITQTTLQQILAGYLTWHTATSNAKAYKWLAGEI